MHCGGRDLVPCRTYLQTFEIWFTRKHDLLFGVKMGYRKHPNEALETGCLCTSHSSLDGFRTIQHGSTTRHVATPADRQAAGY